MAEKWRKTVGYGVIGVDNSIYKKSEKNRPTHPLECYGPNKERYR